MKGNIKEKTNKFAKSGKRYEVWEQGKSYNFGRFLIAIGLLVIILYFIFK